jgi:hypothetical protein
LEPNRWHPFHDLNSASELDPANLTSQEGQKESPAMNKVTSGTITKDRFAASQGRASMHVNPESLPNESDSQIKKHNE